MNKSLALSYWCINFLNACLTISYLKLLIYAQINYYREYPQKNVGSVNMKYARLLLITIVTTLVIFKNENKMRLSLVS